MLLLKRTKQNIICWAIAIVVPIVVILPLYFCSNFGLSNSCLIPGVCFVGYVLLSFVTRSGTFDVFRYQFINLMYSFKPHSPHKYKDCYEYQETMKEKRSENSVIWIPWVVVGVILIILAIIFAYLDIR
ncbi:MAG: DUF3899 domain-containing protein [Bacilli bacterium]|jgi:hypothetical protein